MSARVLILAAALAVTAGAAVADARLGALTISNPQVRASLGANPNTGGYVTVTNSGAVKDRLIGASCACAARVELHEMADVGGMMKMNKVDGFVIPAGGAITLAPRGRHLMFLGLKAPAKAGQELPVTLVFEKAGKVTTNFRVTATPGAADAHGGHH